MNTGGLIRVIHRETEKMTLLRGLTADACDLHICPAAAENYVAAVANNGHIFVWKLAAEADEITCAARARAPTPHATLGHAFLPPARH